MYECRKCAQIAKEMRNYDINILGISEARWNQSGVLTLETGEEILYSGNPNENDYHSKGVAVMLSNTSKKSLMEWEPVSERMMWVRLKAKCQNITIIQCYAPTNDAEEDVKECFNEQLQHVWDKIPKRDIKIVMGDMNAKIGKENKDREKTLGKHGLGEINENGEKLVEFCELNELVIGGSLFPQKNIHKETWESPDGRTKNQIDHIMISQRWRSSLQDVRVMRGADISSDHHHSIAKVKIKLAKGTKVEQKRIKYNVEKLKDLHLKDQFQIELRNRFEVLKDVPDLDMNNEWKVERDIIKEVCEDVLGRKTNKKKDWISHGTWDKVEERRKMKEKVNNARTRAQKQEAQNKHQFLNKEVIKCCRKNM
ncbi:craniofacial development protein 2-like [Mytilus californianus]|uniref:craniofacial development protein 2-like n=1 Tax=Mytilus californianus TaxID=6549 RepID=UPI0022467297|nr:craniofacial development protein 2-like [Mytilus californianus]